MRFIGLLLLALVALGWFAAEVPLAGTPAVTDVCGEWRRTRDGWQPVSMVLVGPSIRRPALHPAVVGMFELLVCVTALVAFPAPKSRPARQTVGQRNHCEYNRLLLVGPHFPSKNR